MQIKVAIFGASGLIGSAVRERLQKNGITVLAFSRKKNDCYYWNPDTKELDLALLEGVDVVLNFSGESIEGVWTKKKKRKIRDSRLVPTEFLVEKLMHLKKAPKLYIRASAIGYYGDKRENSLTEKDHAGTGFLADLVKEWEAKTEVLQQKMRVALLRLGVVVSPRKGIFAKTKTLVQWYLGTKFGSQERMSWIAIDDVVLAIFHIFNSNLSGPINLVAPHVTTQEQFVSIIAKMLKRPCLFSLSEKWTKRIFQDFSSVLLSDLDVIPEKLLKSHFIFIYPEVEEAIKKYLFLK